MKLWTKTAIATLFMAAFLSGCNKTEEPVASDAPANTTTEPAPAEAPAAAPAEPAKTEPGGWVNPDAGSK